MSPVTWTSAVSSTDCARLDTPAPSPCTRRIRAIEAYSKLRVTRTSGCRRSLPTLLPSEADHMQFRAAIVGLSQIGAGASRPAADAALGELTPHSHAGAYASVDSTTVATVCDLD